MNDTPSPPAFKLDARSLVAAIVAMGAAAAVMLRGPFPYGDPDLPTVEIGGVRRSEACLRCHAEVRGMGAAHDVRVLGCSACHLGDPAALDAAAAHREMVVVAGDLSIAARTCGQPGCHPTEAARVDRAVMAGAPGLLAIDAFTFGERPEPRAVPSDDLRELRARPVAPGSAASHVRKLCASCHLGFPKSRPGDDGFASRGGGCTACHLDAPVGDPDRSKGRLHPNVSASVREQRCEGCHARSGRISLSYRGRVELEPSDPRVSGTLPDGRPIGVAPADVHANAGLTCLDCHTERGLMGDGARHLHGYEAVDVACEDCHVRSPARVPSQDAARVAEVLRAAWHARGREDLGDAEPYTTSAGTPLWRTDRRTQTQRLHESGRAVRIPEATAAAYHALEGHERLSCQACHSMWAPRCTSCHTQFDPAGEQVDHLFDQPTAGAWSETAGGNGYGAPLLAVGPRGTIAPFVEGMHLRIDGIAQPVDRRLWAPLDPHTTGKARACATCHSAQALRDTYPSDGETTRVGALLLDDAARARVEVVSRCLPCHERYDDPIYEQFAQSVSRLDRSIGARGPRNVTHDPVDRCAASIADAAKR